MPLTLADVRELDRQDPLATFKSRFALPEGAIYLDGNSLGAQPVAAAGAVEALMAQWRDSLIQGWNQGWFDAPERLGDRLAPLLGAAPGEVLVSDTITHNLYKLLGYITEGQGRARPVILSEGGNFPTDGYIAQGFCRFGGFEHRVVPEGAALEAYLDERVAAVVLSHVHYRTGRLRDMAAITRQVHASGAEVVWDLAHSAGALPVNLAACGVRYAVGCTYKYLNGGPGAPAFLYVRRDCQNRGWQPLSGWLGHAAPFAFEADYAPAPGISQFRTGTHSPLAFAALEASLTLWQEVDLAALRHKSQRLIELFRESLSGCLDEHGISDITPPEAQRGSQVGLVVSNHGSSNAPNPGYAIVQALIERGVIGDYREPGLMRFGFAPLYLSHEDVWQAARHLREVLSAGEYLAPRFQQRGAVT
ncbi:kynureninase [Halomonas sp. MCCC 1A17488]|uniref:kynureninase n=1 Tax=unclassified Halomonas TaxID=2609666 RepID=UPI0018D266F8|nr:MULTISPECIES: kynureninase [unclassified Halomonas]MCE8017676.1 kynureninase [Halomonas sp. MCCC 1A17488]MCG3241009.1 kynureninase [Halomonas sp. MCCC 1A17488]QPP48875.1 kynureninase [Halomonas sp. SS10-MC5]